MSTSMVFEKYPDLPVELQRQIVQEAADLIFEESRIVSKPPLWPYACLDLIWKDAIERHTFRRLQITPSNFEDFRIICGKRHGIFHYINFQLCHDVVLNVPRETLVNGTVDLDAMTRDALETLMGIMEEWDPKDRRRPGLINMELDLCDCVSSPDGPAIHHDFSYLISETCFRQGRVSFIHPRWSRCTRSFQTPITYLSGFQCHLRCLALLKMPQMRSTLFGLYLAGQKNSAFQVVLCLTTPGPRWSDTITSLDVSCINNVAAFLQDAQKAFWPQLKTLKLGGLFDSALVGSRKETGSSVVQGLIACLSKMTKVLTVKIDIEPYIGLVPMAIDLYLGTSPAAECLTTDEKVPFVPDTSNGIARFSRVSIPGDLASELQDVIWRYHGLVVSVNYLSGDFYDDFWGFLPDGVGDQDNFYDGWDWGDLPRHDWHYQQWNQEKGAWECFVFHVKPDESLEIYPVLPEGSSPEAISV